ncbi:MAG: hypothetical protein GC182_09915 [Rhodopseudomonas sp.]|nr:hypothetical protein [Rhodopseudomonas sp.]
MSRLIASLVSVALAVTLAAPVLAEPVHKKAPAKKHRVSRHWHGYGFLPGYRPPEVIERERAEHYWSTRPNYYGPAHPQFYHGRWNGGGFGPCYTSTPIGYVWNCGN